MPMYRVYNTYRHVFVSVFAFNIRHTHKIRRPACLGSTCRVYRIYTNVSVYMLTYNIRHAQHSQVSISWQYMSCVQLT